MTVASALAERFYTLANEEAATRETQGKQKRIRSRLVSCWRLETIPSLLLLCKLVDRTISNFLNSMTQCEEEGE